MTPLDVISLAQAKQFLKTDFADDDALITSIIGSAINYTEQLTNYRLYTRTEYAHSDGTYNVDLFQHPITNVSIQTLDGTPVTWPQIKIEPIRRKIIFERSPYNNAWSSNRGFGDGLDNGVGFFNNWGASLPLYNILIECGYSNVLNATYPVSDIPFAILQAVKTIITNMYENRNSDTETIPSNITDELMSYSRNPMF